MAETTKINEMSRGSMGENQHAEQQNNGENDVAGETGGEEKKISDTAQEQVDGVADEKAQDVEENWKSKAQAFEKDARDAYDRFLRVSADFENYKKRSARDIEDFRKYANESLIKALLPIIDNLERAVMVSKENEASAAGILEGVDLTLKEINKVFESFHVQQIKALDEPFNPAFHEAVMQRESDVHPDNTVIEEIQKGYTLYDRLIRPSMVVVSKRPEKGNNTETSDADL